MSGAGRSRRRRRQRSRDAVAGRRKRRWTRRSGAGRRAGQRDAARRLSERKQAIAVATEKAAEIAALLSDLDRARAGRARTTIGGLDLNAAAGLYAVALKGYGSDGAAGGGRRRASADGSSRGSTGADPGPGRLDQLCPRRRCRHGQALSQIADRADDDDWRHRCRAAPGNIEALKLLAKEAPDRRLPAVSLVQLGRDLNTGEPEPRRRPCCGRRSPPPEGFSVYFDLPYYLIENDRFDPAVREAAETSAPVRRWPCVRKAPRPTTISAAFTMTGGTGPAPASAHQSYRTRPDVPLRPLRSGLCAV